MAAAIAPCGLMLAFVCTGVSAEGPVGPSAAGDARLQDHATDDWTPERMESAEPSPLRRPQPPEVPEGNGARSAAQQQQEEERGNAGYAPGWEPSGEELQPEPDWFYEITPPGDPSYSVPQADSVARHGSPPQAPDDYGRYAPFQRWSWFGDYLQYPVSTVGKLFYRQNGQDRVCTASVIQRNTIATAGHCVHDGSGRDRGGSASIVFCPSYAEAGVNPNLGCWPAVTWRTSEAWYNDGNLDRDYACVVLAPGGTVIADSVGHVTGWLGRAWNWPARNAVFQWGYPAGPPFTGNRIITTVSTEWYEVDMVPGDGQRSKYIGSDQTGGSSGGPWWLNMTHPDSAKEIDDTDDSPLTDPPGLVTSTPLINGVVSHSRCQGLCTAETEFSQELGSPPFRSTEDDPDESEDVFQACFVAGGI
ncbi:MAG: trypsin-like serine peptidase [Gammaproteobacteria bacterium]